MKHAFDAREKAHKEATTALADAVYQHEYAQAGKIADKLPQGWCESGSDIFIDAAGFSYRSRQDGKMYNGIRMSSSRRMPRYQSSHPVKIGGAHALNDQAQAVAEEYAAINRDKDVLRAKLRALVYSVTTLPKLLEAWPDCKRFLPASAPKPTTALVPVELVPELNAALGIKPKTRKTA
ncbi:Nmad5 family putative nucleotide modification protein [Bradyrhizobium sp.]|uniref:Nmad5 family putative nucleotide modification protein n=1 Tax=Bradyrhizobium sp. TaxID=376 RepID=UPI0039E494EA